VTPGAPRWPKGALAFMYGYWRFTEIYTSLILGAVTSFACAAIYFWATSRGILPHLSFEHDRAALGRALAGLFAIAFLSFFQRFAGPDRAIGRRLRQAAAALGLELTPRANALASDWVWARFTTADDLVTARLGGRCWALASGADPSRLLVLNHIPKVLGLSRVGGDKQREILAIMLFWQVGERAAGLSAPQIEQLAAWGFKADRIPDGFLVHEIRRCGRKRGERAIDRVDADRLGALWGLGAGGPPPPSRSS
jgi:hypothetical protein